VNKQEFTAGRSRAAGNLLIDLVIGVVLLGLIAAMLAGVYSNLIQRSVDSFETTRATWMANSAMEVISGYDFADPVYIDNPIGRDGNESIIAQFDDVDDFHGYDFLLASYPAYTCTVEVSWAAVSADGGGNIQDANAPPTFFKRIMVTAQNDMLSNPVSLKTIMSAAGSGVGGGAQIIADEELNNSWASAQRIPRTSFHVIDNPDVDDQTKPWVSIEGNVDPDNDRDIYEVELQSDENLALDIDDGSAPDWWDNVDDAEGVAIYLAIYSGGPIPEKITQSTSSEPNPDPNLSLFSQDGGHYYIEVKSRRASRPDDFLIPRDVGTYVLYVTIEPTDASTGLGGN
tara:strand:+ start:186 stop:1214 length:1029 start_codon:yes stop_codon:yes gene_type:complete